jgi:serine/threonine-protein kinase RsbW
MEEDRRFSSGAAARTPRRPRRVLVHGSYPCAPWAVGRARCVVAAAAEEEGADAGTVAAVKLAVSEACTNVLRHAYRDPAPGGFVVACERRGDDLQVSVADAGAGLAPLAPARGLGLGLPLIAALADAYAVTRGRGGGTRVAMTFALRRP